MAWTVANATRSAMADAFADDVDGGSGVGKIRIYGGGSGRPAGPDTAGTVTMPAGTAD